MKVASYFPSLRQLVVLMLSVLTLAILAACGGGGGSTDLVGGGPIIANPPVTPPVTTPPVTPPPVSTVSAFTVEPVVIADGSGTANVVVKYATTNTTVLTVTLGSETKSVPAGSGEVAFTRMGVSDLPVVLKDNGVHLGNAIVSKASCSANALWSADQSRCSMVAYYDEVIAAIWGKFSTPYLVTLAGATPVKNMTRWNQPTVTVINCGFRRENNPDVFGAIHVACTSYPDGKEHRLYIDVPSSELREVNDRLAPNEAGYVFANPHDYKYTETYDPTAPFPSFTSRGYSKVNKGWFAGDDFTVLTAPKFGIFFLGDDGTRKTIAPGTLEDDGNAKLITTFSNPRP